MGINNTYTNIEELAAAYFVERLKKEEIQALRQWIDASEANKTYFDNLQKIWFACSDLRHAEGFNKEAAYQRFLNHVKNNEENPVKPTPIPKQSHIRLFLYTAAAVCLLLIVSYTSYWQGSVQVKNQFADVVIESPLGSKTKTNLPDGTLVWLNAGSKIIYSQGFGVSERTVFMEGEGYFEVVKNEKIPFHVKTKELQVSVLGTMFNFRNYPEDDEATVSLIEGKVQVWNTLKDNNKIELEPDQKVFLNKKSGDMRVASLSAEHTMEWTNGYLFFDEELLVDIAKQLERSYNVRIHLMDKSLETYRFYGNFIRKDLTIEEIMKLLESTNKIKYEKEGKDIRLRSK